MDSHTRLVMIFAMSLGLFAAIMLTRQLNLALQYDFLLLAFLPYAACVLGGFAPDVWRLIRRKTSAAERHKAQRQRFEKRIQHIWGLSLKKLEETTSLALQRIEDAQERLGLELKGQPSDLYLIIRLGYRSVRLARAINCLCTNGYADEAYALCRNLMELEANIWFIMVSGDAEGNCKRYNAWDNAKFYRYARDDAPRLNSPPSQDELDKMKKEYDACVKEYGEEILKIEGAWAIAYREGGSKKVEARNVPDRAFHAMPYLKSDRRLLYEGWKSRWDHLNSMVHNSPRSTMASRSAPKKGDVVTVPSVYGLGEPIDEAARMMLNISSVIAKYIPAEKVEKSEKLGKRTMDALLETGAALSEIPATVNPWWHRKSESSK